MSKMADLEKLSVLETEIRILEGRILTKQSELDIIIKECNTLKDKTNKEIAQAQQACNAECQEKINEANRLLGEAKKKTETINKREEDTKVIEKQIAELDKKSKAFADNIKENEAIKVSCLEKEKQAELLIEQYNQKLQDLEKANKKK